MEKALAWARVGDARSEVVRFLENAARLESAEEGEEAECDVVEGEDEEERVSHSLENAAAAVATEDEAAGVTGSEEEDRRLRGTHPRGSRGGSRLQGASDPSLRP